MRRLADAVADRLRRLRWMAVPVAAYLAITLVLPAANGAAARPGFARHAAWVLGGCAAMVVLALVASAAVALVAAGVRRVRRPGSTMRGPAGDAAANNPARSGVLCPGGRA